MTRMRCMWIVGVLAAVAMAVPPPAPDKTPDAPKGEKTPGASKGEKTPDAPKGEKPKAGPFGEYAALAAELKLTDEQKEKLEQTLKASAEELSAWQDDKSKGQRLLEIHKAMKEAKVAGKEPDDAKALGTEQKALMTELADLKAKQEAALMGILTDEQKASLTGLRIYAGLVGKRSWLGLTDEQKAKIKDLCITAGKEMDQVKDQPGPKGQKDPQAEQTRKEALQKLENGLREVLTEEQKAKLDAMRKEGPKEGKKPGAPAEGAPKDTETKNPKKSAENK